MIRHALPRQTREVLQRAAHRHTADPLRAALRQSRDLLGQMVRLHTLSVTIGRLEPIADSGVSSFEIREAAKLLEAAASACAEIDRHLSHPNKIDPERS